MVAPTRSPVGGTSRILSSRSCRQDRSMTIGGRFASEKNWAISTLTAISAVSVLVAVAIFGLLARETLAALAAWESWISWYASSVLLNVFYVAVSVAGLSGGATLVALMRWKRCHDRGDGTWLVAVPGVGLAVLVIVSLGPP